MTLAEILNRYSVANSKPNIEYCPCEGVWTFFDWFEFYTTSECNKIERAVLRLS